MDVPVNDARPKAVTCCWHWRHHLPGLASRIVGFVFMEGSVRAFAAEYIDTPSDLSGSDPAPGRWKVRRLSPLVRAGIVHLRDGKIAMVVAFHPSADGVDLPGQRRSRQMIARSGQRRARAPSVSHGIVHFNRCAVALSVKTTDRVQFA